MAIDVEKCFPLVLQSMKTVRIHDDAKDPAREMARAEQYSARSVEIFFKTIRDAEGFVAAGAITATEFKEFKEFVNREYDKAWSNISRRFDRSSFPKELQEFKWKMMPYAPELHNCKGALGKMQKSGFTKHPFIKAAIDLYTEMTQLVPFVETFKKPGFVQKKQPKKPEDVKAKYLSPPAGTPSARILKVLEDAVNASFEALLTSITNRKLGLANKHPKKVAAYVPRVRYGREVPYSLSALYLYQDHEKGIYANYEAYDLLKLITEKDGVKLLKNYKAIIADLAKKEAEEIRTAFLVKNLKKINSIVEKKGGFKTCKSFEQTVRINGMEGEFFIDFEDGSSFYFVNSIVGSHSSRGKYFLRFPLRFHNVKLPGGKDMGKPSEKRMHDVFTKQGV